MGVRAEGVTEGDLVLELRVESRSKHNHFSNS